MDAIIDGRLSEMDVKFSGEHAAVIVMASGGYPVKYQKGFEITGLEDVKGACVYHAGTKLEDGRFYTNGGRVLGVTALGGTLKDALNTAYDNVGKIAFKDAHFRTDIGKK